jgi:uncharacterized protein (TIGR02678 family)
VSNLGNQLAIAEQQDIALAIRTLLATPLLTERTSPAEFDLVRRRKQPVAQWFDYHCGWRLIVEPRFGYARLVKIRSTHDRTRPARRLRSNRLPFDRRRYVLLCVAAAELLSGPATTIGMLAERIKQATAADPVLEPFDTAKHSERMAYVDALRLLESFGALEAVDGTTDSYVESRDAKVLYRVDTTLLLRLLSAPNGPSQLATEPEYIGHRWDDLLSGLSRETRYGDGVSPTSDVQRNLWLRHSICRELFDEPVVYRDSLTDEQRSYLSSITGRQIIAKAAEQAGFVLEERTEGYLLVDPDSLATDRRFPDDSSTANVAALFLLEPLVAAEHGLTAEQLRAETARILARFPKWAKTYQGEDGAARLANDAIEVLTAFRLAEHRDDHVRALPAAVRYTVAEVRTNRERS